MHMITPRVCVCVCVCVCVEASAQLLNWLKEFREI